MEATDRRPTVGVTQITPFQLSDRPMSLSTPASDVHRRKFHPRSIVPRRVQRKCVAPRRNSAFPAVVLVPLEGFGGVPLIVQGRAPADDGIRQTGQWRCPDPRSLFLRGHPGEPRSIPLAIRGLRCVPVVGRGSACGGVAQAMQGKTGAPA